MTSSRLSMMAHGVCILLCGIISASKAAAPVNYNFNFNYAGSNVPIQARAWLPDSSTPLKGLILSIPGSGNDTRGLTGNSLWQFRLPQMGFGIVGFRDISDFPVLAGSSAEESTANLQIVMDAVASSFARPEIKNAPVILDGISKGGYNVGVLATHIPERTICYIADKGYQSPFATSEDYQVPGIAIAGAHDEVVTPNIIQPNFMNSRANGATLAQLVDWQHGHLATNQITKFAFMDQAMRVRYPKNKLPSVIPNTPLPLNDISNLSTAWLGEANQLDMNGNYLQLDSPLITPLSTYPGDTASASWLPTEAMAMVYRAHNDNAFVVPPIQITLGNTFNGKVPLQLSVNQIDWTVLRLYHDETLIATFGPSENSLQYTYQAKENGLHTFIAVADYVFDGIAKQTSNYNATVVAGVTVPEPTTLLLMAVIVFAPACYRNSAFLSLGNG